MLLSFGRFRLVAFSNNLDEPWGIVGKGRIESGYDADLVLVDLEQQKTIRDARQHTKSRWSPWDGKALNGWPVVTWVGGHQVWSEESGFDEEFRSSKLRFDHSRGGYCNTPEGIGT